MQTENVQKKQRGTAQGCILPETCLHSEELNHSCLTEKGGKMLTTRRALKPKTVPNSNWANSPAITWLRLESTSTINYVINVS